MDYHSNYIPQCCGWCGLRDKTRKNLKNFKWSRNKKFFDELYDPNLQSSCEKPHLFCYSCRTQLFKQLNNARTENAKVEAKEDMKKKLHIFEDHVFSGCFICLQFEDQLVNLKRKTCESSILKEIKINLTWFANLTMIVSFQNLLHFIVMHAEMDI